MKLSEKVIFLDIDGVLCLNSNERDEYGGLFEPGFVENLETLVRLTGAKIVISSSWRASGLKVMQEMWASRSLPGKVIDVTPASENRFRGDEIAQWLKENGNPICVIIDDDNDFYPSQMPFYVNCSTEAYGLTFERAMTAVGILNLSKTPPSYLLQFFKHSDEPEAHKSIAKAFSDLAYKVEMELPGNPEKTTALRKLLEAKDCAVRAYKWI